MTLQLWKTFDFCPERPLLVLIMLAETKHLFQKKIQVIPWNNWVCQHVTSPPYLEGRIQLMQQSVNQDVELQEVNSCVLQGCPDQMKKVPKELTHHNQLRDELFTKDRTAWRALKGDLRRCVPQGIETCFMSLHSHLKQLDVKILNKTYRTPKRAFHQRARMGIISLLTGVGPCLKVAS